MPKVTERVAGNLFRRFIQKSGEYCERRFAHGKGTSVHHALLLSVLPWLALMEHGFLVRVISSDVSGAFDQVYVERMAKKLATMQFHRTV